MTDTPSAAPGLTGLSPTPCIVCSSPDSNMFINQGAYSIRSCARCGLRFLWPQPGELDLTSLYDDAYFKNAQSEHCGYSDYLAQAPNHRRLSQDRLRRIPKPRPGSRLLDIGTAAGFFVEQASLLGWDAEGTEINDRMARYGREVLGCRISDKRPDDFRATGTRFDVVTMWEVIEHLARPDEMLRTIHALLRPGGYLALSTPDSGSLAARLMGRRWPGWRKIPEHLYYFDAANLSRLLRDSHFEIVSHSYVPLFVDVAYALDRLAAVLHAPAISRFAGTWGRQPVRINPYYDLMLVAYRP